MIRNWFYKCRPEEFPMASISFINRRIWSSLGYYLPNQLAMKILQTIQKHNKNRFVSLSIMRRRICCEQTFRHNCCFVLPKNKSHSFMNTRVFVMLQELKKQAILRLLRSYIKGIIWPSRGHSSVVCCNTWMDDSLNRLLLPKRHNLFLKYQSFRKKQRLINFSCYLLIFRVFSSQFLF